jgi:RNA polymerase sigma factor (sigma-70 family)
MNDLTTLTDGQLLKEFVEKGNQGAFAIVVERHTRMVLAVCRSVLGSDAEDAAQATFVALAKKASSLSGKLSVGAWLHHVAHCVAVSAYRSNKSRAIRERKVAEMTDTVTTDESGDNEVLALVNRELDAMPEKYRHPLVLFHLENASLESAARLLACPLQTVGTRLARGREMLRKRLLRHGVTVSGAAIGILLSTEAGAATIPAGFVSATTQAAVLFAAGKTALATGAVSAKVLALAQSTLKAMFYAQVKLAAIALASVGLLGATGVATYKTMATAHPAMPFSAWEHKMKITFSGYNRTEVLKNFPALVTFDSNPANFAYGQFASTKGYDLRFSDATQTGELNYEVERWNANGQSCVWVQVPELRSSTDCIWAYWGNPAATAQQPYTTNGATWDATFNGVWHLAEKDASGKMPDSTAFHRAGGVGSATTPTSGMIAGAWRFTGDNKHDGGISVGDVGITGGMPRTISGWARSSTGHSSPGNATVFGYVGLNNDGDSFDVESATGDNNNYYFVPGGTANPIHLDSLGTTWKYMAVAWDGMHANAYVNGRQAATNWIPNKVISTAGGAGMMIGYKTSQWGFDGSVDEVRVENVARSSNWLWACWMNMASNSVFNDYGSASQTGGDRSISKL